MQPERLTVLIDNAPSCHRLEIKRFLYCPATVLRARDGRVWTGAVVCTAGTAIAEGASRAASAAISARRTKATRAFATGRGEGDKLAQSADSRNVGKIL